VNSGRLGGDAAATAIIVAAGSGERLGAGGPKALVEVAGRPMFEWSLIACEDASRIDQVVIAIPPGEAGSFETGDAIVVEGGATRSESVAAGLAEARTELVAIHDAARPMVTPELFDAAVSTLVGDPGLDGVVVAASVTDTVKQVDRNGMITGTPDRDGLMAARTPQVFRREALVRALDEGDPGGATDDAALVEASGGAVTVLELPGANPKITWPEDLDVVEALFERSRGRMVDWRVRGC
jgi:2-C-methyl-D-erythritol 4-phosphate cytidylyltransferase